MLLKTIPLKARIENQPYGIAGILYHGTEIYESWTTLLLMRQITFSFFWQRIAWKAFWWGFFLSSHILSLRRRYQGLSPLFACSARMTWVYMVKTCDPGLDCLLIRMIYRKSRISFVMRRDHSKLWLNEGLTVINGLSLSNSREDGDHFVSITKERFVLSLPSSRVLTKDIRGRAYGW